MLKLIKCKNKRGLSLVELILVLTIIGIFAAMAIPNLNRARSNTYRDRCITNLRKIAAAKENWSLDTGAEDTSTPNAAQIDPYIEGGTIVLACILDKTTTFAASYDINDMSTDPVCKIDPEHTLERKAPPPPPPLPGGCGGCY